MTKEKKIPKINLPKEKIQKVAQKTVQSIAPAVGGWWQFMKIKVGPVWSVIIILVGLLMMLSGLFWAGLMYILFSGPIAMLIVKYARPDFITTSGSLLMAKLGLDLGYPILALGIAFFINTAIFGSKAISDNIQSDYEFACSEAGIKKSGKTGCEKAKERLRQDLEGKLPFAEKNYQEETQLFEKYTNEKAEKCTEEGIVEYGSDGCEQAKRNLEKHRRLKEEYQQETERLTQKIAELKK